MIIPIESATEYIEEYIPQYKTILAAGCDLKADIDGPITIPAGASAIISSGIKIALPQGLEAQVRGRSGLNFRDSIIVPVGTIDADYRGIIKVKLYNLSIIPYTINPKDSIAQMIVAKVERPEFVKATIAEDTDRGAKGFGSTGK